MPNLNFFQVIQWDCTCPFLGTIILLWGSELIPAQQKPWPIKCILTRSHTNTILCVNSITMMSPLNDIRQWVAFCYCYCYAPQHGQYFCSEYCLSMNVAGQLSTSARYYWLVQFFLLLREILLIDRGLCWRVHNKVCRANCLASQKSCQAGCAQ